MSPKKRHHNHEIDNKAVNYLEGVILDFGWVFRNQEAKDYGIDAELERCRKEGNDIFVTGEIFKLQIKGTERLKTQDKGDTVIYRLDKNELSYLCNELTVASVLIIVDVTHKHAFWFDVKRQGKELLNAKKANNSFLLKTSSKNIITAENAANFYKYLQDAEYLTATQSLKRALSKKEIASALLDISGMQDIIAPPGHKIFPRPTNAHYLPGTVMSILEGDRAYDVVQSADFKPGDEIKVNMLLQFPKTPEGKKAQQEWADSLKNKRSDLKTDSKFVKEVKITAGGKEISTMRTGSIQMGPVRKKMDLYFRSQRDGQEIRVTGEGWMDHENKLFFDSTRFDQLQAAHVSLKISPNKKAEFSFRLNDTSIRSCTDAYLALSALSNMQQGMEIFIDDMGIKRKIAESGGVSATKQPDATNLDLLRRLALLEEKMHLRFPFEKIGEISKAQADHLFLVSELLEGRDVVIPATISVEPKEPQSRPVENQYARVELADGVSLSIMSITVSWRESLIAEGKCASAELITENNVQTIVLHIPECRIYSSKTDNHATR